MALRELPDLIVMDLVLPGRGGYAVIRELKGEPGGDGIRSSFSPRGARPRIAFWGWRRVPMTRLPNGAAPILLREGKGTPTDLRADMAAVEVVLTRVDPAVAPRLAGLIGGVAIRARRRMEDADS
jgi:CheY-like chemotaxis protein